MTLVGLDLDGTLVDSRRDMVDAVAAAREELGLAVRDPALVLPFVHQGMDRLYARAFDDAADPSAVPSVFERAYAARIAVHTRLYPGVHPALGALAAEHRLALVTNKPEALSELLLEALGVRAWFAAIVGGDSCAVTKPHPEVLELACARAGVSRTHAIHAGDAPADIQLARAFGCPALWCAWGYRASPEPSVPDVIVWHPDEWAPAISRLARRG